LGIEHDEEGEDEEEEDEDKERNVFETRVIIDSRSINVLTFRDVEEWMSTFSGGNNVNVQR
jgi:hypothetical protein